MNSLSKKDAYPPNMNEILDKLRARYISTIDLSQTYFQISLAEKSREITAFSVPSKRVYHFTRMPYSLTRTSATFQRLLDRVIDPKMKPFAFVYLDDIVIIPTFEEHMV